MLFFILIEARTSTSDKYHRSASMINIRKFWPPSKNRSIHTEVNSSRTVMTGFKRSEFFSWIFSVPGRIFALNILWLASVCCKIILGADSEFQTQSPRNCFPPSVTYRNQYLTGQVFQRLQSYDWLQCLTVCAQTEDCISYNFKLGTCELNNGGITQWGKECLSEKSLKFSRHQIFHQVKGEQKFLFTYQKAEEAGENSLITRFNETYNVY